MTTTTTTTLDERDQAILDERMAALDAHTGPRVGDFVRFADGVLHRFAHDWDESGLQTASGGSFYLGHGYTSMSGSLDPTVARDTLRDTGETREGIVWFFRHDFHTANNAVNVSVPFRVFETTVRFNGPAEEAPALPPRPVTYVPMEPGHTYNDAQRGHVFRTPENVVLSGIDSYQSRSYATKMSVHYHDETTSNRHVTGGPIVPGAYWYLVPQASVISAHAQAPVQKIEVQDGDVLLVCGRLFRYVDSSRNGATLVPVDLPAQ